MTRRLLLAELRSYVALVRWVLRRPMVPAGAHGFRYVGVILPVLWTFIGVSAVELVAVHLVLPWPGVRLVADILGIWGLAWMVGFTAALTVRVHVVDDSRLLVRNGFFLEFAVPWDAVASVTARRRGRDKSRAVQIDRGERGTVLNVVVGSQTTVDVVLNRPVDVQLDDRVETVTEVRLHADDAKALVAAARDRIGASGGVARRTS